MISMKKAICLIVAVLVCISLACPVLADEFVPSISYKGTPDIITIKDDKGNDALGVVRNTSGSAVGYLAADCLLVTPVSEASDSDKISEAAKNELLAVYKGISDGTMKLPYGSDVDASKMVVKDLFDVSWACTGHNHDEALKGDGTTLELTFDLGVKKDEKVVVMTYNDNAWSEIAKVVNNGDGTVTCTFEHLCPVSVSVLGSTSTPGTGDNSGADLILWTTLMVVSAAVVVTMVFARRKAQQ